MELYYEFHIRKADEFLNQNLLEEAALHCERAIAMQPKNTLGLQYLGKIRTLQGLWAEALELSQEVIRLTPKDPIAYTNCNLILGMQGADLRKKGQFQEAAETYQRSLQFLLRAKELVIQKPSSCLSRADVMKLIAAAYSNLGEALAKQGKFSEARVCFEQALSYDGDLFIVYIGLYYIFFREGDFRKGASVFQKWRSRCLAHNGWNGSPFPEWDGSCLKNRSILLMLEQGLGDQIQFLRYASFLKERGGRVIAACHKKLAALFRSCPWVDHVLVQEDPMPDFDVGLLSMQIFSVLETTKDSIPAQIPYLFPDPTLVEQWREKLSHLRGKKVGIAWQGNVDPTIDPWRSVSLALFFPFINIENIHLVSLQVGEEAVRVRTVDGILNLGEQFNPDSLSDAAAVLQSLDLVITIDSAMAHLAGALGIPVWVALQYSADWRWFLETDESPWYPTMRLFRQKETHNWEDVFARMYLALRAFAIEDPRREIAENPHVI